MNTNYYIGIDVGKTTVIGGLLDKFNNIIETITMESGSTAEQIIRIIGSIIYEFLTRYPGMISGIGIATFGVVDTESGIVISSGVINDWRAIEIQNIFETRYSIPVTVENDVKAALYGEYVNSAVYFNCITTYFSIGTSIGMATIINNSCLYGENNKAGEVAYLNVPNSSSKFGEKIGGWGISEQYFLKTGRRLNAKEVFDQYSTGDDPFALEIYNDTINTLVMLLEVVCSIIDPKYIILGGAIGNNCELFLKISEKFDYLSCSKYTFLQKANCGILSGVYGAAMLAKNSGKWIRYDD